MANNKITLDVELKTSLNEYNKIKSAGGFQGKSGEKQGQKILSYIEQLQKIDYSKLSGPELTKFNNDMKHMRKLLDSAARSLSNYSKEILDQQKTVEKAEKKLGTAQEKQSLALKKRELAAEHIKISDKNTFFNMKTGRQVSNIDTIADLFSSNQLEIRGKTGKKAVSTDQFNKIIKETGIQSYAEAKQEVANAKIEVSNAKVELTGTENKLTSLLAQQDSTIHPVTSEVTETSVKIARVLDQQQEADTDRSENKNTNTISGINANFANLDKQTSSLGKALKQFTLYKVALKAVKMAVKEAVTTVKELDKELTEQAMVTGLTRKQTYGLVKSYQELALQTGATTKEIASVATEYMKQGKSIKESLVLTEAAVAAAKVARVSTADSVNYLTTALNGFQLAAEDAMLVSDKFAAVAAASATDYDELAIALSKVASQANLAGMSIDYTTALLTKGLETTREAPETMGTALKTIIARMRELGDYGETLEGDTDINNVETQLAYVGIALRNTEGELRSTEDVLDELGKKWDTLNKNQQAAVAKALAGTRQQSRLIALMTDYERVTELQEIAQRSAGATAAQADVYLQGIEASMNKIQVAWEKIVTSITDSEFIVSVFSGIGKVLENTSAILETAAGQVVFYTIIASLGMNILGTKIQEHQLAKELQRLDVESRLNKIAELKEQRKLLIIQEAITKQEKLQAKYEDLKNRAEKGEDVKSELLQLEQEEELIKKQIETDKEYQNLLGQELNLKSTSNFLSKQEYAFQGLMLGGQAAIIAGYQAIVFLKALMGKQDRDAYAAELKKQALEKKGFSQKLANAGAKMAESVAANPFWGWATAIAILAAVGIGLGVVAAKNMSVDFKANKTAESINKLSNEIYKLEEKANNLESIASAFEGIDNKVIKTNEDLQEMNKLLGQAADSFSTEKYKNEKKANKNNEEFYGKGMSEQDYYNSLSDIDKIEFIKNKAVKARMQADQYRDSQYKKYKNASFDVQMAMLNEDTTNTEYKKFQSAMKAINNNTLYDYIDLLKDTNNITEELAQSTEAVVETMLKQLDTKKALNYVENPQEIQKMVDAIKKLKIELKDVSEIEAATILASDDYGITEKARAFRKIAEALGESSEAYKMLSVAYAEYETFAQMSNDVLELIDHLHVTGEEINNLVGAYQRLADKGLNMTLEQYKDAITSNSGLFAILRNTGGDIAATIYSLFGDVSEDVYELLVNTIADALGQTTLNIGQTFTSLENKIQSVYETASKWNQLSQAEIAEFITDNAKLFEDNPMLLQYLENNDWVNIQKALSTSDSLEQERQEMLKIINTQLEIQKALGDKADKNLTTWLEKRKKDIENTTDLFSADLDLLIKQEQKQLDIYRDYLEKQQNQLEDALEKRKEAYEEYFKAINEQEEEADYLEESSKIIANIAKLSTTTNASAQKQRLELEQQLADLEKERQKELREKAQEAVVENIDKQVQEINNKFEELLNDDKKLLDAMQSTLLNPNLLSEIATLQGSTMTSLQLEDYVNSLVGAFSSALNISDIEAYKSEIMNNATFNVGGQTFNVNEQDGNVLWNIIEAMMRKYGVS